MNDDLSASDAPASADEFAGNERFQVRSALGSGAFGKVYEVYDREQRDVVALKLLKKQGGSALYRFKREFRALAGLKHRNLVNLYELLSEGGSWFYTMELVHGSNLLDYVRTGRGTRTFQSTLPASAAYADLDLEEETLDLLPGTAPKKVTSETFAVVRLNEERLRQSLIQLAEGLNALHEAGKLHCDIKPSNVVVRADGRLVLLDFGVVLELGHRPQTPEHPQTPDSYTISGTPAYVAPEQAHDDELTEASDWYSVGVMLYEALTATKPYTAKSLQHLFELKCNIDPPMPDKIIPGLPKELCRLCEALLSRDPASRPSGQEVLQALGYRASRPSMSMPEAPFVGRSSELGALQAACEAMQGGKTVVVAIQGISGVGKSALVDRFLQQAAPEGLVLRGRCYETESMPYKALDGVIDALCEHLKATPAARESWESPHRWALLRLFPVLELIPDWSSIEAVEVADSREVRRRGFEALKSLLAHLGRQQPLILAIDDLQWGDPDSCELLVEVLGGEATPRMLLLLTMRSESPSAVHGLLLPELATLRELSAGRLMLQDLHLGQLDAADAQELARTLGGQMADDSVASIVKESEGSPFLLTELIRYARCSPEERPAGTLDEMLLARVNALPDRARRLLQVVATAGRPVCIDVVRDAGELHGALYGDLEALGAAHLIRAEGMRAADRLETYHDRIRESVVLSLTSERRREIHHRLALALRTAGRGDTEAMALHFAAAGKQAEAAHYGRQAAELADRALAFDRAAQLYTLVLEQGVDSAEERAELQRKLGDAWTNAGRGAEAARVYLEAADAVSPARSLELRRQAAEQLLTSGHTDEGLAVVSTVLESLGMKLPRTPRSALAALLWRRMKLRLRGLKFRMRDASEVPPADLLRIDTCHSVAKGLGIVAPLHGEGFQCQGLLLALRAGEPFRVARALCTEVGFSATGGERTWRRTQRLTGLMTALVKQVDEPYLQATSELAQGVAWYLRGGARRALEHAHRAERILRTRCTGVTWELDTARFFIVEALWCLAEFSELEATLPNFIDDARRRGDLYAEAQLRLDGMIYVHLARDNPDQAIEESRQGLDRLTADSFYMQHQWKLSSNCEIKLYMGDGKGAWRTITESWPLLKKSMLLYVGLVKAAASMYRGRAALATAASSDDAAERRSFLRLAARDGRFLARSREAAGRAMGQMLLAGTAAATGRDEAAERLLASADRLFEEADNLTLYRLAAQRRRGELLGGDEGARLVDAANAAIRETGCRNPDRWVASYAPGWWWTDRQQASRR